MSHNSSNVTSAFIDLATFDELEKYMYGGPDATAYFVRETRKSTWFSQVPVCLSKANGNADFGNDWSVSISRAGDYLLSTWLRVSIPNITVKQKTDGSVVNYLSWCNNLMHNLVKECNITFNDLVAARFDSHHLDFWSAFTVPKGKLIGYQNMIGNMKELTEPNTKVLPLKVLNLPLPFFFSRDSGVALPTAALPYNDMRINLTFRNVEDLLVHHTVDFTDPVDKYQILQRVKSVIVTDVVDGIRPTLNANVWANYAIVSNDERKRMACAPRDILIEQVQSAPLQNFSEKETRYDIRFSHAIKVIFFGASLDSELSNYTESEYKYHTPDQNYIQNVTKTSDLVEKSDVDPVDEEEHYDPISTCSLIYENTSRLSSMGSDYFSLVNPWYHAPVIPEETGFHSYSYSLDFISLDPMGSTNFGKLTNVSLHPTMSDRFSDAKGKDSKIQSKFVVSAVNNNIIRISGGALGFPVL